MLNAGAFIYATIHIQYTSYPLPLLIVLLVIKVPVNKGIIKGMSSGGTGNKSDQGR